MDKSPGDDRLQKAAAALGISEQELSAFIHDQHDIILEDSVEEEKYPLEKDAFLDVALTHISNLHKKHSSTLKKLIHRDERRKLYLQANELEAVGRILYAIENATIDFLDLSGLELLSLPELIRKARHVHIVNIPNNRISDIEPLSALRNLEALFANNNRIEDINCLRGNQVIQVLCLNNNPTIRDFTPLQFLTNLQELELANCRINDSIVVSILQNPTLKKIRLAENPINAPLEILNDLDKMREYFGLVLTPNAENDEPWPNQTSQSPPPNQTKHPPEPIQSQPPSPEQFVSYSIRDIHLRGNPDKVLLDIEKLAPIFYDLISNSDRNGEHFFGLFGRWGRGKTFFWKYLLQNNLNKEKYIPIEFHAWKYQDTPGIWAYLYNTLNEAYLGDKPKLWQLKKTFQYFWKLLKLNSQRGKLLTLGASVLGIVLAIIGYFYNQQTRGEDIVSKFLRIGIPVSIFSLLFYMAKTFKTDARKIISSLTTNVNFNSQLGFQHEIQHELKCLVKAWIPEKEKFNKRIFLFIDDIDRCSEDKIIQIVDYIRVLLHCQAIQDRVTVLAAIDERILLHAIQQKYKLFIENKDNDATYKELCREYMDKLFLAGLKLGPLTEFEKRQIVEGFTDTDTSNEEVWVQYNKKGIDSEVVGEVLQQTQETDEAVKTVEALINQKVVIPEGTESNGTVQELQKTAIKVEPKPIASTAVKQFPYEKWEQEFIKEILARNTESTPRSIRVYTYRYLLGKQLVEKALKEGKPSWKQWYNTKEAKQCFAIKLLHYGFKSDTDHLLADYKLFVTDYSESRQVPTNIYGYEVLLNQELGSIMYQVLTMIIAY